MDELYAGTYTNPPSTSPAGAKGKKVWWLSCGQSAPSCAQPAEEAGNAAKVLGIDFHVADTNFNAGGAEATAVRTAIAAGADAIMVYGGGGCEGAKAALQEAKAKGIMLMGVETPCSDPTLWTVQENYSEKYPTDADLWKGYSQFQADYIINSSGGNAKIIAQIGHTGKLEELVNDGFLSEIQSKCPGCEVVAKVDYVDSDLAPNGPWIQAFRAALVKHPETTAVWMPWDLMMTTLGGAQAVKESGITASVSGGQAAPDGLDAVRQGKVTAMSGARSPVWSAYAAMDTINRALVGEKSMPAEGLGFQVVDATHNMPPSGDYVPPIDFKAAYLKAWNNGAGTA